MFHKKISYFLVLTFCFLLFLPSCSNNVDTPEQSIQRVLTTIFTCPDNEEKEYGKILNKNKYSLEQESSQTEIAEAEKRMQEHLCQKYSKDDFTEAYYNSLFKHLYTSLAFPTMCILNEAEISPISVTVEKDATTNIYLYTAKLNVTKGDSNPIEITQTGRVQTDGDGHIAFIDLDDSTLFNALS